MNNVPLSDETSLILSAQAGDKVSQANLVGKYQRLVYSIANRFFYSGACGDQTLDDMTQWGNIGLLHAVEKYNPERGKFLTYAFWWIRMYITRYGAKHGHSIDLTYRDLLSAGKIRKSRAALQQDRSSEPTTEELSRMSGVDLETVEALEAVFFASEVRLDNPTLAASGDSLDLCDAIPDPSSCLDDLDGEIDNRTVLQALQNAISNLPVQEREVMTRRYMQDPPESFRSIGVRMNLSGAYISLLEKRALKKLRGLFPNEP